MTSSSLATGRADDPFLHHIIPLFARAVDVAIVAAFVLLQQLGRGLRVAAGKDRLTLIEFIGNHRIFLDRIRLLAALPASLRALIDGRSTEGIARVDEGYDRKWPKLAHRPWRCVEHPSTVGGWRVAEIGFRGLAMCST